MNSKENIKTKIALILVERDEPITVKEISNQVQLSEKTIRKYIDEIEYEFKEKGIEVIRKTNVGIQLKMSEERRAELKRDINIHGYNEYTSEYRQQYILKTLFKNRYTYTIQLLSEDLYCSKGTILNDLIYVQKWLEKYGLCLKRKQNQGLWIEGSEKAYRDAMMSLFFQLKENSNEDIDINEIERLDYRIDYINYKKLKQFFPRTNFILIQSTVQEAERKLGYSFTDQAFINIIAHIAIMIERIKFERKIEIESNLFQNIKQSNEYVISKWMIYKLSKEFEIEIPEEETVYLSLHLLGAKIQENINQNNYDMLFNSENKVYIEFAKEIIILVGEILEVDLSQDKMLLLGLALHLRPTIVRLKYGLQLRNPLLGRIKKEFVSIYGAAWACNSIFERRFGVSINEDEVAYIALHIAVAMERLNERIRTVIVCSSGIGTSQMVARELKKQLQQLEIIDVIPLHLLTDKLIEENDLIISTIPIRQKNEKIVNITTLVDERDILIIKNKIDDIKIRHMKLKTKMEYQENIPEQKHYLEGIITKKYCFIEEGNEDFLEIVKKYANLMETEGIGSQGFCKSVIDREIKSSTVIGRGIAIPHSTEEYVKKLGICIIKLNNPVKWNNEEIDLILILALRFSDLNGTKEFFKNFYSVLDNEELIRKIKNAKNEEEIVTLFLNGGELND
ncbi:BglG family transcription antiterminator [Caloramator quimbayensis]|nr:BglG family transcription antiterminator [Caloramator quimbayensis]